MRVQNIRLGPPKMVAQTFLLVSPVRVQTPTPPYKLQTITFKNYPATSTCPAFSRAGEAGG